MDLALIETGNGGDLQMNGNDLSVMMGYENMPYLPMFGGNEWWGNDLLFDTDDIKFSAQTEAVMSSVALNSSGRIAIESAIIADLQHLKDKIPGTKIDVSTSIINVDRLDINITINGQQFFMQWNPSTGQLNYNV